MQKFFSTKNKTNPLSTIPIQQSVTTSYSSPPLPKKKKAKHTHGTTIRATYPSYERRSLPIKQYEVPHSKILWSHVETLSHLTAQRELTKLNKKCPLGIGNIEGEPDNKYQRNMLKKAFSYCFLHSCLV